MGRTQLVGSLVLTVTLDSAATYIVVCSLLLHLAHTFEMAGHIGIVYRIHKYKELTGVLHSSRLPKSPRLIN
jgi:hypothetical protein